MIEQLTKRILSKKKKKLSYTNTSNIGIFGASQVGKTQIINIFATSIYGKSAVFKPTFTECYERKMVLRSSDGTVCKHELSILDTSGKLRYDFPNVYRHAILNCEAFVLVCSMDDEESIREIEYMLEDIDALKKTTNTPVIIIANKADKLYEQNAEKIESIRAKITKMNRGCCFERSALHSQERVTECLVTLMTRIEKRKGIERSSHGVKIVS